VIEEYSLFIEKLIFIVINILNKRIYMTKLSFFIRFTLIYTLIMAGLGILFGLLAVENAGATNLILLFGVSYWLFHAYGKKNSLSLVTEEKWSLIGIGMLGSLITTVLLGIPTAMSMAIELEYLLFALLVTLPLNLLVFVFAHKGAIKTLTQQIKQTEVIAGSMEK
jgi:hypothetical protein